MAEGGSVSEWIWLVIGATWGLWVNYNDANYYKNLAKLQQRYIDLLNRKLDGE